MLSHQSHFHSSNDEKRRSEPPSHHACCKAKHVSITNEQRERNQLAIKRKPFAHHDNNRENMLSPPPALLLAVCSLLTNSIALAGCKGTYTSCVQLNQQDPFVIRCSNHPCSNLFVQSSCSSELQCHWEDDDDETSEGGGEGDQIDGYTGRNGNTSKFFLPVVVVVALIMYISFTCACAQCQRDSEAGGESDAPTEASSTGPQVLPSEWKDQTDSFNEETWETLDEENPCDLEPIREESADDLNDEDQEDNVVIQCDVSSTVSSSSRGESAVQQQT